MECHETPVAQAPGSPDRAGFARAGVEVPGSPDRAGFSRAGVEVPSPVFRRSPCVQRRITPPSEAVPQAEQDVLYLVGLGEPRVILGWTAARAFETAAEPREPLPLEYPGE